MMLEEVKGEKFTYNVFFKPGAFKKYSNMEIVNVKKEMTEEEADKLNKNYGKLIASKSSPKKPEDDDLYIAIYKDDLAKQEKADYYVKRGDKKSDQKVNMSKGDFYAYRDKYGLDSIVPVELGKKNTSYDETYIRFLTLTDSEYQKLKKESTGLEDFEIKNASPEEIFNFAKASPIKDGKNGLRTDPGSMSDTIKRLKEKEKKDDYKKNFVDKEPEKVSNVSKEASDFIYDNDRMISSIIASYQLIKDKISNIKDRIDAEKEEEKEIERLSKLDDKSKSKADKEKEEKLDKKRSIFNASAKEEAENRAYLNIESKIDGLVEKIKAEKPEVIPQIISKLETPFKSSATLSLYNRIVRQLSNDLKENMKRKVKETSSTGTGATATPGEGEGMATKYAFAGAGAAPKKKKKMKEAVNSEEEMFKAEAVYDLIKNTVMNMTVKKALTNLPKIKEFYGNLEKASGGIATLADKYEDSDPKKYEKLNKISSNIIKLDNILADLISIYEKAQTNPVK